VSEKKRLNIVSLYLEGEREPVNTFNDRGGGKEEGLSRHLFE